MASNIRTQLEMWLKTISVSGSVLDVGGLSLPIKGRTDSWNVTEYKILDNKKERKGVRADYIEDLNKPTSVIEQFDNVFCLETLYQVYDLMESFRNLSSWTKSGGSLFFSTHFMFPYHTATDCTRLTRNGINLLCEKNGLKVKKIVPRMARSPAIFGEFVALESKVRRFNNEIGYLVQAIKI